MSCGFWPLLSSELGNVGRVSASQLFLADSCGPQIYSEGDHDLILAVRLKFAAAATRLRRQTDERMICFSCTESVSFNVDSLYEAWAGPCEGPAHYGLDSLASALNLGNKAAASLTGQRQQQQG